MVADATSALVLFGLILALRFEFLDPSAEWRAGAGPAQLAAAYGAIWVGSLWLLGLYRPRTYWSLRGEVIDLLRATFVASTTSFSLIFLLKLDNVSRLFVIVLLVSQPMVTALTRLALRIFLGAIRSRKYNSRQVLIVGTGAEAHEFARELERHSALGLQVTGFLAAPGKRPEATGMFLRLAFSVSIHLETEILLVDEVFGRRRRSFPAQVPGTNTAGSRRRSNCPLRQPQHAVGCRAMRRCHRARSGDPPLQRANWRGDRDVWDSARDSGSSFSSDTIAASGEASLACFRKRLGGNLCKASSHCGRSPRTVTHSAIRAPSTTNGDTACHLLPS